MTPHFLSAFNDNPAAFLTALGLGFADVPTPKTSLRDLALALSVSSCGGRRNRSRLADFYLFTKAATAHTPASVSAIKLMHPPPRAEPGKNFSEPI